MRLPRTAPRRLQVAVFTGQRAQQNGGKSTGEEASLWPGPESGRGQQECRCRSRLRTGQRAGAGSKSAGVGAGLWTVAEAGDWGCGQGESFPLSRMAAGPGFLYAFFYNL